MSSQWAGMVQSVIALLATPTVSLAQTQWVNAAGGNWSLASNWNPANVPDTEGESAVLGDLGSPYEVLLDFTTSLGAVDVAAPVRLEIWRGRALRLTTGMQNDGLLSIDNSGLPSHTYLRVGTDVSIDGAGTIELVNSDYSHIRVDGENATLTIGPDQKIVGAGGIEATAAGAALALHGIIDANIDLGTITIACTIDGSAGGVLQGTNGGMVVIASTGHLTGGTMAGGVMGYRGSVNGTSATGVNGILRNATLRLMEGGLHNDGTLIVNMIGAPYSSYLYAGVDTIVDGSGNIELLSYDYSHIRIDGENATLTIGPEQSITGAGTIAATGVGASLDLQGTINSDRDGAVIEFTCDTDATGGGVLAGTNGGTVAIRGQLTGGTMAGGVMGSNGSVNGTSATGVNGILRGGALRLMEGGLHNDGTLIVNMLGAPYHSYLYAGVDTTVDGSGNIELLSYDYSHIRIDGENATLTIGPEQSITGAGKIEATATGAAVVLEGSVKPGHAGGDETTAIRIDVATQFSETARTRIQVGGTAAGALDQITGSAAVALDGVLELELVDGYVPAAETRFTIIDVGTLTGSFDRVETPQVGLGVFRIVQSADKIEAVWTCQADLNGDGQTDFFDVQLFLQLFTDEALYGDYNEDGNNDFFDVLAFLNDFSLGCL